MASRQYLAFRLGQEHFAVEVDRVKGILPWHEIIAPDGEPESGELIGHAFLRGNEIPVIDLRRKLRLNSARGGRSPCIVVVDAGRWVGFVADRVSEVIEASTQKFRNGKLHAAGRPRRLLDLEELFPDPVGAGAAKSV